MRLSDENRARRMPLNGIKTFEMADNKGKSNTTQCVGVSSNRPAAKPTSDTPVVLVGPTLSGDRNDEKRRERIDGVHGGARPKTYNRFFYKRSYSNTEIGTKTRNSEAKKEIPVDKRPIRTFKKGNPNAASKQQRVKTDNGCVVVKPSTNVKPVTQFGKSSTGNKETNETANSKKEDGDSTKTANSNTSTQTGSSKRNQRRDREKKIQKDYLEEKRNPVQPESVNNAVKHMGGRKKHKAKVTTLFAVINVHIKSIASATDYLHLHIGNGKTCHYRVVQLENMDKNSGCSLVTLEMPSLNKAHLTIDLLHKSNKDRVTKVHCFLNKQEAEGKVITSSKQREVNIKKTCDELLETATSVLDKHEHKTNAQLTRVDEISKTLASKKRFPLSTFEKLSSEKAALTDKLKELCSQRKEYIKFLNTTLSKLNDIKEHSKYEQDLSEIRKDMGVECRRLEAALPMYARREDILSTIRDNQVCVILGETGSGKSTQMVQYLHQAGLGDNGIIACTQPRKIAATSLALHVSKEMASSAGQTVGYQVGMQTKKSSLTKVVFLTDHILLNECIADKLLSKYSCIVIDEAHERSIFTDLLLGMLKKCMLSRPELKIVVTSATIDPDIFVRYFGGPEKCPVLTVSGRAFPVEVMWCSDDEDDNPYPESYESKALEKTLEIHKKYPVTDGDILVFLTSVNETERCAENFRKRAGDTNNICLPLHGRL